MSNQTCEIDVCPKMVVCACTSAEGHKRRRLGEELGREGTLITTANTRVEESVFNQLRKPGKIAALKVVQQIPTFDKLQAFTIGVMGAELGRMFPQLGPDLIMENAVRISEEMTCRSIPFTLTATDVVLRVIHPKNPSKNPLANINQPGEVSDRKLMEILTSKVGDCGDPCLQDGLIGGDFIVGMAACEMDLQTGMVVGQSGEVTSNFLFRPIPVAEIADYVRKHGKRARKVNGGIMWEYWQEYIEVINGVGKGDDGFEAEMNHLMAMTSGIPGEMSEFLYDLSRRHHLIAPGCVGEATSEVNKLAQKYLGRNLPEGASWRPWYPNFD